MTTAALPPAPHQDGACPGVFGGCQQCNDWCEQFENAMRDGIAAAPPRPSITCPVCGATSHHPVDIGQGYCGRCHQWTSPPGATPRVG